MAKVHTLTRRLRIINCLHFNKVLKTTKTNILILILLLGIKDNFQYAVGKTLEVETAYNAFNTATKPKRLQIVNIARLDVNYKIQIISHLCK